MMRRGRQLRLAGRWAAGVLLAVSLVALVTPSVIGWHDPSTDRQVARWAASEGILASRTAIKLVSYADLRATGSRAAVPLEGEGYVWVAIAEGVRMDQGCAGECPAPRWWVNILLDGSSPESPASPAAWSQDLTGNLSELPAWFDRLPDRAAPSWWLLPLEWPGRIAVFAFAAAVALMALRRRRGSSGPPSQTVASTIRAGAR